MFKMLFRDHLLITFEVKLTIPLDEFTYAPYIFYKAKWSTSWI